MRTNLVRAGIGGVSAGLFVLASAISAQAGTCQPASSPGTYCDAYDGGTNYYPTNSSTPLDVIQDSNTNAFDILGANVSRPDANHLVVQIFTNFAGVPTSSSPAISGLAAGTTYGSLFLTPVAQYNPSGSSATNYYTDNYQPLSGGTQWKWAVPTTASNGSVLGSSNLYQVGTATTANPSAYNNAVNESYKTTNGLVTMSNVAGDPVSYPNSGNPYFYFRQGQAVQYTPDSPSASNPVSITVTPATGYTTANGGNDLVNGFADTSNPGSITYTITDNGTLGYGSIELAWAMTCANDVIQFLADVSLPGCTTCGGPGQTPLPAAFALMGTVVGAGGLLARLRRRVKAQAAA